MNLKTWVLEIKKLIVIGKSDPVITMITDNLESNEIFPKIEIYNNLKLPISHPIKNENFLIEFTENFQDSDYFFLGVNKSENKFSIFNLFNLDKNKFIKIIHKSAQISKTSTLGFGCLINSSVSVAGHTTIGDFVSINRNSSIGHHTIINNFVTINPGVNIAGFIEIGEKTTVGMGSNIIDNVKIGKNVIIGAGSLVTKDIPDNVVAYGNPCKIVRKNEK